MHRNPSCPGCRTELEEVTTAGRSDDLYLCAECSRTWFAFELGNDVAEPFRADDPSEDGSWD